MKKFLLGFLGLGLLLAGCQEPVDPVVETVEAPKLVSCDPADGAKDLTGDRLTLKLTFDQNIKCPSDQQTRVTIDGGASVDKVYAYNTLLTIDVSGLEKDSGNE